MSILAEDNRNDPFSGNIGGSNETASLSELQGGGGGPALNSPGSRANTSGGVNLVEQPPSNWMPLVVGLVVIKYMGWI